MNCPKTYEFLSKWRNFAKSGHTAARGPGLESSNRILLTAQIGKMMQKINSIPLKCVAIIKMSGKHVTSFCWL